MVYLKFCHLAVPGRYLMGDKFCEICFVVFLLYLKFLHTYHVAGSSRVHKGAEEGQHDLTA